MAYHGDVQSSFRSCINYTNGTPQLCWSRSSWLQSCRSGLAAQSGRSSQGHSYFGLPAKDKPSAENSQAMPGVKSCSENSKKNINIVMGEIEKMWNWWAQINGESQISPCIVTLILKQHRAQFTTDFSNCPFSTAETRPATSTTHARTVLNQQRAQTSQKITQGTARSQRGSISKQPVASK